MIKINKFNIFLTIRRLLGILIVLMGGYLATLFCIKFIFYILYAGTEFIDGLFKFLVKWEKWKIAIVILATKILILLELQDIEQCTEIKKKIVR